MEIVRGYIDEGRLYIITDSVGDTERGEYAIPKQEDDLWEEASVLVNRQYYNFNIAYRPKNSDIIKFAMNILKQHYTLSKKEK